MLCLMHKAVMMQRGLSKHTSSAHSQTGSFQATSCLGDIPTLSQADAGSAACATCRDLPAASTLCTFPIFRPSPPMHPLYLHAGVTSSYVCWSKQDSCCCRTHEQGEEQLAQILNEGITTFICLQVLSRIHPSVHDVHPLDRYFVGPCVSVALSRANCHRNTLIQVCMQGEIPPQQEMRIGGVRGFVPYAATASLLASAMGAPPGMQVIARIQTLPMLPDKALDTVAPFYFVLWGQSF